MNITSRHFPMEFHTFVISGVIFCPPETFWPFLAKACAQFTPATPPPTITVSNVRELESARAPERSPATSASDIGMLVTRLVFQM